MTISVNLLGLIRRRPADYGRIPSVSWLFYRSALSRGSTQSESVPRHIFWYRIETINRWRSAPCSTSDAKSDIMTCKADHRQSQATLYDVPLFAAAERQLRTEQGGSRKAAVLGSSLFSFLAAFDSPSAQPCGTFETRKSPLLAAIIRSPSRTYSWSRSETKTNSELPTDAYSKSLPIKQ